jgi:hypothetical protein
MRNIAITLIFDKDIVGKYTADIIPLIGEHLKFEGVLYTVSDRTFISPRNQVELSLILKEPKEIIL